MGLEGESCTLANNKSNKAEQIQSHTMIDVVISALLLLTPITWICSGFFIPSDNKLARIFGFIGAILYAFLSLGIVLAILVYLIFFVPAFPDTLTVDQTNYHSADN